MTAQAPTVRSERRERRREQLLDAADRVIRRGATEVSMDEIAAEAGITKPVLYRHFGDKSGLYEALAARYVDELRRSLQAPAASGGRARLAATIEAYLEYVEREPERYRFLLRAAERPRTSRLVADFRSDLARECAFATVAKLRRAGLDDDIAEPWAHSVSGTIRSAGIWWLETQALPRERLTEYLTAILWEGVAALRRPAASVADARRTPSA